MAKTTVNFTPQQLLDELVDQTLLFRLGTETIAIIRARTAQGKFLEGSTTQGYSTKPAPMPIGGIRPKTAQAAVLKLLRDGDPSVKAFTSTSKKIWVTLQGGYRQLRELAGRTTDAVDLVWTGDMMRSIHITHIDVARKTVTMGFSSTSAGERATFHHEGAGRSRIKRIFLGLSSEELSSATKAAGL